MFEAKEKKRALARPQRSPWAGNGERVMNVVKWIVIAQPVIGIVFGLGVGLYIALVEGCTTPSLQAIKACLGM